LDINWDDDQITWITSARKFTASFTEFGDACQINYEITMNGEYVWESYTISNDTHRSFYKPNQYNGHELVNELKVMPVVINKILRFTLFPKTGNSDTICDQY
jgi:hypothetical protein